MQLRRGMVTVTIGSASVRGVYVASLTGVSGSAFTVGEDLLWGVDGVGLATSHDTIASTLYFTRLSGEIPASGVTVRNPGNTKIGSIASFASTSVPDFSFELSGPGGPKIFTTLGSGLFYNVLSQGLDFISLAGEYQGATTPQTLYAIVRDYTVHFGWPVPAPSDIDLASILSRAFASIDSTLYGVSKIAPTFAANWSNVSGSVVTYYKDADRVVHLQGAAVNALDAAPSLLFTLPTGYRPLYAQRFPVIVSTVSMGVVEVAVNGDVTVVAGLISAAVYLGSISFRGEA